ncbi:phage tail tape measure protein [Priestia flexa]|uniref:phage tail tape measure protein n=1 Tax=Priestia flexa TaxID=86664 RepID=UPI0004743779|nr:phage tail tape measure protein [Priestia flexa]
MSNDISILLSGNLDFNKTKDAVNNQIKALEKKIDTLKINIDINDNVLKTMAQFSRAVDDYKKSIDSLNKSVQTNERVIKNADGTIDKYTQKIMKNGEIQETHRRTIDNRTKSIKNESEAIKNNIRILEREEQLRKKVEKVKSDGKKSTTETYGDRYNQTTYKKDNSGNVTDRTTTDNFAKAVKDAERLKIKIVELNNAGVVTNSSLQRMNNVINGAKTEAELNRVERAIKRVQQSANNRNATNKLNNDIGLFQQNFAIDAEKARRQNRGTMDTSALNDLVKRSKEITASTPNAKNEIRSLQVELKKLTLEARTSSTALGELGRNSLDSFGKFAQWMGISTVFYGIARGARSLVTVITEVDTAMTNLKKVMSPTTNFDQVLIDATDRAKELGKTITQVLDAYEEFARQGYNQSELKDMSDAALIASNVGEMEAGKNLPILLAIIK